jgi:hypothetical protein
MRFGTARRLLRRFVLRPFERAIYAPRVRMRNTSSVLGLAYLLSAACASSGSSSIEAVVPPAGRDAAAPELDAAPAADASPNPALDAGAVLPDATTVVDASPNDAGSVLPDATGGDAAPANCGGGTGACTLLDPCALGGYRCNDAGAPQCTAVGTKPNGAFCGFGLTCQNGACVQGVPTDDVVLIAKYVESAWFKAVVLWNPGSRPVDLARYGLCLQSNQYTSCNWSVMLSGTLAANGTFVLCNGTANPDSQCDVKNTDVVNFNGDDRLGLYFDVNQNGRVDYDRDLRVDHFGEPGVQPAGQIWGDKTYRRHNCVPYLGGRAFNVSEWFDDVSVRTGDAGTFQPDRTNLRVVPVCR